MRQTPHEENLRGDRVEEDQGNLLRKAGVKVIGRGHLRKSSSIANIHNGMWSNAQKCVQTKDYSHSHPLTP